MSATVRSAITMAVLVALLLVGLVWGWSSLTRELPSENLGNRSTGVCTIRTFEEGSRLTPEDVTVSVLNASSRNGLARQVQSAITDRGFVAGSLGNISDVEVGRVAVIAQNPDSAAVQLVRTHIGTPVPVITDREAPRDGVVVVVGDTWDELRSQGRAAVRVPADEDVCGPEEVVAP